MTVEESVSRARQLLDRIAQYSKLVSENEFEGPTVKDMRGNAKALCDGLKAEADSIKAEIGLWE